MRTIFDMLCMPPVRVESGSDGPDYLNHLGDFFGGSSGSHLQTKLSGCDPHFKKKLASDKRVNLGSGECTEPSLV